MKKENLDKINGLEELYNESPPAFVWDKIVEGVQDHEFTTEKEEKPTKRKGLWFVKREYLAMAASFALIAFISILWMKNDITPTTQIVSNGGIAIEKPVEKAPLVATIDVEEQGAQQNEEKLKEVVVKEIKRIKKQAPSRIAKVVTPIKEPVVFTEMPKEDFSVAESTVVEDQKQDVKTILPKELENVITEVKVVDDIKTITKLKTIDKIAEVVVSNDTKVLPKAKTKRGFFDKAATLKEIDPQDGAISMIVSGLGIIGKELGLRNKRLIKTIEIQF